MKNIEMQNVTRINLKTACKDREELINFCLNNEKQYLAIGWSYVYSSEESRGDIRDYGAYYDAVRKSSKRINPALNIFWYAKENDLFWTRDREGFYWICRAIGPAIPHCDTNMDIGALLPVKAYKAGKEVPGQIKASFNRPRGGTAEKIYGNEIVEFSKYIYNLKSGEDWYAYEEFNGDFLSNLPDFELEELVISYLQIKENYYVLSNSIANRSTTVKIECEFISRDRSNPRKAVVQVKGGKGICLDAKNFEKYSNEGYNVYLYAPEIKNLEQVKNVFSISKDDLEKFYHEYRSILPESIIRWNDLFHVTD